MFQFLKAIGTWFAENKNYGITVIQISNFDDKLQFAKVNVNQ